MTTSDAAAEGLPTTDEVVAQLAEMVEVSRRNPTMTQRLFGQTLSVLYEFDGEDGTSRPYVMRVGGDGWGVTPGRVDADLVDIVIRTTPATLHQLTSGALGGREAVVSGRLNIRKAPSMPKMLLMRALFNQHKKARARGQVGVDAATFCAVEDATARLERPDPTPVPD